MYKPAALLATLTAAASFLPVASADLIDWATPVDTTATTDVSTAGTLVAAYAFAPTSASPTVTVNGVSFAQLVPDQWDSGGGSLMAVSSTGDTDYDELLRIARTPFGTPSANPSGFGAIRLDSLVTLELGKSYEVQVWYCDQRFGQLRDRLMTMSSATGNVDLVGGLANNLGSVTQGPLSQTLDADPNNLNGATDTIFGQYCIGSFTRSSAEQLWLLVEGSHPVAAQNLRPHLQAMQIREVDGSSLGGNYCGPAVANSTGSGAVMSAAGSNVVSANDLTLTCSNMPLAAFGYFITSQTQGNTPNAGMSTGTLCLGGAIGRYIGPGQIQNTGATGVINLTVDLNLTPQPTGIVSIAAGETWNFQAWFRDAINGTLTSNFSDGVVIAFQ